MKWHLAHRHEIPGAFDALGKDYEAKCAALQQQRRDLIAREEVAVSPEKPKALPRKRKTAPAAKAKKAGHISCTGGIRSDLEAGFFNEPRSTGDVKQRLREAGFSFTDSNVRNSLKRLTTSGALDTTGRGGTLRYHRAKQS